MTVYELVRHWDEIEPLLAPAVATDTRSMDDVKVDLITGDLFPFATPHGLVVVAQGHVIGTQDTEAIWVLYAAGKSSRTEYRDIAEELAQTAQFSGCSEIRIEGRRAHKWAHVLGGFEHVSGDGDSAVYRRQLDG
jgi:hypothetical protein